MEFRGPLGFSDELVVCYVVAFGCRENVRNCDCIFPLLTGGCLSRVKELFIFIDVLSDRDENSGCIWLSSTWRKT